VVLRIAELLAAIGAAAWLAHFKYIFHAVGWLGRDIEALNTDNCVVLEELAACESMYAFDGVHVD
jgi:hypothetical protein